MPFLRYDNRYFIVPAMTIYASHGDYHCELLDPEYLDVLWTSRLREAREFQSPMELDDFLIRGRLYLQRCLNSPREKFFGLLHDGKIIGHAQLSFINSNGHNRQVYYMGSYIMPEYRGQGLSALLYEARQKYLLDETEFETAMAEILLTNKVSHAAAIKNGFVPGEQVKDYRVYRFRLPARQRDLNLERAPAVA